MKRPKYKGKMDPKKRNIDVQNTIQYTKEWTTLTQQNRTWTHVLRKESKCWVVILVIMYFGTCITGVIVSMGNVSHSVLDVTLTDYAQNTSQFVDSDNISSWVQGNKKTPFYRCLLWKGWCGLNYNELVKGRQNHT